MWILSVLPSYAIHGLLTVGIIGVILGFVLGFIPLVGKYKLPIQIISIFVLTLALYLEGGLENERIWQSKVKEVEAKVAVSEVKAVEKTVEIQEKIVNKTKVIKQKGDDIIKYIDKEIIKKEEIIKYIENCPVPQEIIEQHNKIVNLSSQSSGEKK
jgi:hypothetical protein